MASSETPIVIFSAGFGDGHNSAARGLAAALDQETSGAIKAPVIDLFEEALPRLGAFMKWGYSFLTTRLPGAWKFLYDHAERSDPRKLGWDWFGAMHRHMSLRLAEFRPRAFVSTYPLYPYILADARHGLDFRLRNYTVVTDSITINSVWLKASADRFFVTDEYSHQRLTTFGIPGEKVETPGFAVAPVFAAQAPRLLEEADRGFRVLYFATAAPANVRETLLGLLRDLPQSVHLTVVMGRHEHRLGEMIRGLAKRHPERSIAIHGWHGSIPQLLADHDLVISKGGGATLHECLAAGTPALINLVIPGQEEGNAQLLEKRGCGWRHEETHSLGRIVAGLITSGAWRAAKENALHQRKPDGALRIARKVLADIGWPVAGKP